MRGRTRQLVRALHDAWIIASVFGYRLCVSPEPVPSARELFDDRLIRLPMSPGIVASRAEVRVALTRTVGARGWALTDGRGAFPALAETVAGIASLVLLDLLGVEIRWDALAWNADTATRVTESEVATARAAINVGAERLARVARSATGG